MIRFDGLDALRGLTLISMILYHACWDLVWMFGVNWPWYRSYGAYLWQQSVCWTFILLSGYCFRLGRNPLRRGLIVSACGVAISLVTILFMPDNRVFFGVLSLLGAAMLITVPLDPVLKRVPRPIGMAASFALFLLFRGAARRTLGFFGVALFRLPDALYCNDFTACFGFPPARFFSTDYFPLLPWYFLFLTGYFLYGLLPASSLNVRVPILNALGRRSLWVYMLHQPVIYAALSLWFRIGGRA